MNDYISNLRSSLSPVALGEYATQQLSHFFPDGYKPNTKLLPLIIQESLKRFSKCAYHINNRYYFSGNETIFNHMNGDHYAMFLYFMARTAFEKDDIFLAERFFYLNKALHSLDIFYEVEMPDIFILGHAGGSVLGRGEYENYFVVSQNCTVGNNGGKYPKFSEGIVMYANSIVTGDCTIGANTHISANAFIRNQNVAGNCVVFGQGDDMDTKPTEKSVKDIFFRNF